MSEIKRPTRDELISICLEVIDEFRTTPISERTKESVRATDCIRAVELIGKFCGYFESFDNVKDRKKMTIRF